MFLLGVLSAKKGFIFINVDAIVCFPLFFVFWLVYLNDVTAAVIKRASGYDMGTAHDYFSSLQLVTRAGLSQPPAVYLKHVEAMFEYE